MKQDIISFLSNVEDTGTMFITQPLGDKTIE